MKKYLAAIIGAAAMTATAGVPVKWTVETSRADERVIEVYHGESLDMEVQFKSYGEILQLPTNEIAATFWQTNGMGTAYWRTNDVEIVASNGIMRTTFGPEKDVGAKTLRGFIGIAGQIYRAAFVLRFKDAPGYNPSIVEWPYRLLDYAGIETKNDPYYKKAEADEQTAAAIHAALNPTNADFAAAISGKYDKTGGKITGDVTVTGTTVLREMILTNDLDYPTWGQHMMWYLYDGGWVMSYLDENGVFGNLRCPTTGSGVFKTIATAEDVEPIRVKAEGAAEWLADATNEMGVVVAAETSMNTYGLGIAADEVIYAAQDITDITNSLTKGLAKKLDKTGGTITGDVEVVGRFVVTTPEMNDEITIRDFGGQPGIRVSNWGSYQFPGKAGLQTFAMLSDLEGVQADLTDATNYTDEVAGELTTEIAAKYPNASGNVLAQQVAAIGAHLNGEDARFVVTNYDSVVHEPEAYVEIKVSNDWIRVWDEATKWAKYETWKTNVDEELSMKADRAWGIYDSETGGYSPAGYTQVSSSNILIAAGMAYQRTVTSGGAVWVLQCNSGVAQVSGDTNGYFRVMDSDGVTQFEIIKGDRREMGCDASGISLDTSTTPNNVVIPYSVVSEDHPTLYITESLAAPNWKAEMEPDCIGTVTWTGTSGAYVATVHPKQAYASMFIRATYMVGGETYIRNNAPVGMDSIILNGVKYYLGTATISGHTVLTLSTTAP